MRQNFKGNKRRKEELRKKKQEEKRNKRLNRKEQASRPDQADGGVPAENTGPFPPQDDFNQGTNTT